tara:strand:- start:3 stop:185 length:183 start_codon:yes stop_codon:yes gene_type:complete
MDSYTNISYDDLKKELKADAEYWSKVVTPYPGDHFESDDSLDYEEMLYDDHPDSSDAEQY